MSCGKASSRSAPIDRFKYHLRFSGGMADEPFMLVSLNEEKAKKLAQVISNETCTKLLKHFSGGKDGTETEIARALGLPLSTVHYNLKQLVDAKLVVADEYHYSEKGKEVLHYRLANKYIIIAPEEEKESFLHKLKGLLPAALITAAAAIILKIASDLLTPAQLPRLMMAGEAAPTLTAEAAPKAAAFAAPMAAPTAAVNSAGPLIPNDALLFFLGGAVLVLLIIGVGMYVRKK